MATQINACPYCGVPSLGMKFCINCGAQLHIAATQTLAVCPRCGASNPGMQFCTNCGLRLIMPPPQAPVTPPPMPTPPKKEVKVTRKYGALRAVAAIFRIIGWMMLIGGSLFSIAAGVLMSTGVTFLEQELPQITTASNEGIAIAVGGIIVSVVYGLLALAFADICSVLMDIEANTRQQAGSP